MLIGIPMRVLNSEKPKACLNRAYLKILKDHNLKPLPLAFGCEHLLDMCAGVLLPGGGDVDPVHFNEENKGSKNIEPEDDQLDETIVCHALQKKLPLLGICRGMQAINVFMGGTLHQDISCSHKHIISGHKLETFPNHLLAFDQAIAVNSFHHQAVKELAPGLIAVAKHLDGTIEAFVHRSLPIIGIQWHPELLPDSRETKTIFECFRKLSERKNS